MIKKNLSKTIFGRQEWSDDTIVTIIVTHLSMFIAHDILHAIQIKYDRDTSRGALMLLDKYKLLIF